MKTFIFTITCFLTVFSMIQAQYLTPILRSENCSPQNLLEPSSSYLMQAMKSKFPKKFLSRLGNNRNSLLEAKYKLAASKLLARHLKGLNPAGCCNTQNAFCERQQSSAVQPILSSVPYQCPYHALGAYNALKGAQVSNMFSALDHQHCQPGMYQFPGSIS